MKGGGQYHSIYDDFYWYTHFSDTDFAYGKALAQTAGTMMMRFADADVLPYQFGDEAETVHNYVTEVKRSCGHDADDRSRSGMRTLRREPTRLRRIRRR